MSTAQKKTDQATDIARLTQMTQIFGGNIQLQGGHYGNALLTRGKVIKSINHALPNIGNGEQRGVLDATIELKGQTVRVLATHFDHRKIHANAWSPSTWSTSLCKIVRINLPFYWAI